MTIPGDSLGRSWVELSLENLALIDSLRPALICFLAFDANRDPKIAGTGFIIAGDVDFALLITAKHVLTEGVLLAQKPSRSYAASALFVPQSAKTPSIDPKKLKAVWLGDKNALTVNVAHANYCDDLDIASCVLTPQDKDGSLFQSTSIPLDTNVPVVGDFVYMVSLGGLSVSEMQPPKDLDGAGHEIQITHRVIVRGGIVTGVYPNGYRQYKWPCFTTSIPAKPGMSGGFVSLGRVNETISACGIVCADNSIEEAHTNFFVEGESVVASSWTALALRAPVTIPSNDKTQTKTLHEMMQDGTLPAVVGDIGAIQIVDKENGGCTIGRRK